MKKVNIRGLSFEYDNRLRHILAEIQYSVYILDLEYDYDDEGGKAVSIETWSKAVKFVFNYAEYILDKYNIVIIAPDIQIYNSEEVVVLWENSIINMYIIISNEDIRYYGGDNRNKIRTETIKGTFLNTSCIEEWFACWLKRLTNE